MFLVVKRDETGLPGRPMAVAPRARALPADQPDDDGEPFGVYAPYRKALLAVLGEPAAEGAGTRLEALARRVVAQAEAGDREALRDIVDRLDGKAFVNEGPARPPRKLVFGWKDAFEQPPRFGTELARRLKDN
jgi:hypothetical protein